MDGRWRQVNRDSKRELKVILHPSAPIEAVRRGEVTASDDSIDLSPYVTQGSQSAFETTVTLKFNRELFGDTQPQPNQILEIQLKQDTKFMPIWIGVVDSISSFTLQRGERSMQLVAKTRDQGDIWRNTKRVTELFPIMTNLTFIATKIARSAGLKSDELAFPPSAFTTAHSNTQLADMNAWDMINQVFLPMGWTPFIDCVGRLRAADRSLQGRRPNVILDDSRLVKVGGQRQRPPRSRVRVLWLNPELKKNVRQGQIIRTEVITIGWFLPYFQRTFYFSDDKTLRAQGTYKKGNPSVNSFSITPFVLEKYTQQTENQGKLKFINLNFIAVVPALITLIANSRLPDLVPVTPISTVTNTTVGTPPTIPQGRLAESIALGVLLGAMINMGTGTYEIWGNPFDWVHARNTSIAFDSSVPPWVDNGADLESDFIVNEEHAKAVAIRELIYQARAANKWSVTLVDDPRIEYGDLLQFFDGTQLYVEDFSRSLERGSEATLDVKGFLVKPFAKAESGADIEIPPTLPSDPVDGIPPGVDTGQPPPAGGGGGGGGGFTPTPGGGTPKVGLPNLQGVVSGVMSGYSNLDVDSCSPPLFLDIVAALRAADPRVGFNGKRGGSERSKDAIAYYYGDGSPTEGSHDVYIVDVIGCQCPQPGDNCHTGASWINVSHFAPGAWYSTP